MFEEESGFMQKLREIKSAGGLRGLIALNAALLLVLAAVTFGSTATAQNRGRGEYTMVAGGVPGSDAAAVYIVDVTNQEMIVMTWNNTTKLMDGVAYRNLAADTATVLRGRTRPAN